MLTIHDVARHAGVSSNTAARILRGLGGRQQNVTRVMQAAQKLGYVRNLQAASLRSGRSNLVGVILPSLVSTGYTAFFQPLHDALTPHGYNVQVYCSRGRVADEAAALLSLERSQAECIYLNAAEGESDEACDAAIERLTRKGVRVVLAGRESRDLNADLIVFRNQEAMSKAVAHLAKLGRKRLVFLGNNRASAVGNERYRGFLTALRAHGLEQHAESPQLSHFDYEDGYEGVRCLWDGGRNPDGIVCLNDRLAIGALRALADLKKPVPDATAVIGLGDTPVSGFVTPRLTTLCPPYVRIAADVAKIFTTSRENRDAPVKGTSLFYDLELIVREST
jgi:DNA-binding LacI/PurR family transcriptional regulator